MASVLAPWPFLESGAAAVSVATVFDGATLDETILWAGGAVEARGAGGELLVRRGGEGGFELLLRGACDGVVAVGAREVELRELSLCGVTALPIGPRTRVTLRDGAVTVAVAG